MGIRVLPRAPTLRPSTQTGKAAGFKFRCLEIRFLRWAPS